MAFQFSDSAVHGALDAIETAIGTDAILRIRTGTVPATCATADSGTVLAEMTLPSDWLAAASGRAKTKSGTWQDTSANATGTAGHFRIYNSAGTVCHIQGTCGQGTGDLQLDNTSIATGQSVTITAFTLSGPAA
jgi:hypothetical protein